VNGVLEARNLVKSYGDLRAVDGVSFTVEPGRLCDHIIIVDHGKVIASDTLDGLRRLLPTGNRLRVEFAKPLPAKVLQGLQTLPGVASAAMDGERLALALDDLARGGAASLSWLSAQGVTVTGVASERVALEDIFLALTGRSLRDS